MNKQKKSKIDILLERAAKEYANNVIKQAFELADANGTPLTEQSVESMHNLIESSFIAGECHMYQILIAETAAVKKKANK